MAKRFWIYLAITLAIIIGGLRWTRVYASPPLRTEHAEPGKSVPQQIVAVVLDGKQFHDPSCRYLHGKPQMMTAEEAVKMGYSPDPRCMRKALQK
jgi:hypothetical protein